MTIGMALHEETVIPVNSDIPKMNTVDKLLG
jgi:hypothetical protein